MSQYTLEQVNAACDSYIRRIRELEAALRPVANHMVIDRDNEFIGGCYAIDVVQTAKGLVGSVLEPLGATMTHLSTDSGSTLRYGNEKSMLIRLTPNEVVK